MTRKTVIITGLTSKTTERLVRDLDRYCDTDTRIVVSAWEGQKINVSDVESCDVIFTKDPGDGPRGSFKRQLYSTVAGLDFIEREYESEDRGIVLRIRSDFKCMKNPFSMYRDVPVVDRDLSNLSNKVWIDARQPCHDGKIGAWNPRWPSGTGGVSDWTCMGRYEDVREWYTFFKFCSFVIGPHGHSSIKTEKETKECGGYAKLARGTADCETVFLTGNIVKVVDDPYRSPLHQSRKFAREFLDENIYFYSLTMDMGMLCVKYPLGVRFIKDTHKYNCFHKELVGWFS
tara:strand:- start:858 stop:1721 length:864 start_codon:yes stop_codon:yes gene_type:complete